MGVSPIAATAITGFGLVADKTNTFSTSPQVTGKIYAANYASPTPANLTTAVSNMEAAYTDAAGRKLPVKLDADVYRDSVRIKLPPGYKIDEMPAAVHLDSRYGAYQASWKADGGDLVFEQSTEIRDSLVPAAQYAELRAFFEKIAGNQKAPVVLMKK